MTRFHWPSVYLTNPFNTNLGCWEEMVKMGVALLDTLSMRFPQTKRVREILQRGGGDTLLLGLLEELQHQNHRIDCLRPVWLFWGGLARSMLPCPFSVALSKTKTTAAFKSRILQLE